MLLTEETSDCVIGVLRAEVAPDCTPSRTRRERNQENQRAPWRLDGSGRFKLE